MANNHLAPYYGALVLHLASVGLFLAHAALKVFVFTLLTRPP